MQLLSDPFIAFDRFYQNGLNVQIPKGRLISEKRTCKAHENLHLFATKVHHRKDLPELSEWGDNGNVEFLFRNVAYRTRVRWKE